jgi:hypothetical protein
LLSSDEGKGWQQLGETLMPNPAKDAGSMMESFNRIGEQTLHSVFGGASLGDLHNAVGAMYGPQPLEMNSAVSQLPQLDLFDSSSSLLSSSPSGGFDLTGANTLPAESLRFQGPGTDAGAHLTDATSPLTNISKVFGDMMNRMTDLVGSVFQGPMGLLGGLLNFLLTIFSEILSSIGQAIEETAKAAATLAADLWKKQLEMTT